MAGQPESYFREPDEAMWAARWSLVTDANGRPHPEDFVRAVIGAGSTPNGVCGVRIMRGSLEGLLEKLPSPELGDLERLTAAFGPIRFVHLRRRDVVAQAVSWCRAEQTRHWQDGDASLGRPHFDRERLTALVGTITEHNEEWTRWLERCGVAPLQLHYEDVEQDLETAVRRALAHVGVSWPDGHQVVPEHVRQADTVNADWISRYREERG